MTTQSREDSVSGLAVALAEPRGDQHDCFTLERRAPLLPALPFAADVRAGTQRHVSTSQVNELGHAKPGLDGEQQQRAVARLADG